MKRLFYSPLDGAARREICSTLTHLVGCAENTPTHAKRRTAEGKRRKEFKKEEYGRLSEEKIKKWVGEGKEQWVKLSSRENKCKKPEMDEHEKRLKMRKRTRLIWLPTTI